VYGAYRADGHGAAAYEPSMMVTLVLYAFATEQRSSRAIECHCRQDVAYRVITGNVVPDHASIARFVVRHEEALAGLFGEVLKLCDQAGLVKPGVVAIDGTRLAGNASQSRNRGFERIAREIVAEARATDEAEDEQHGEARGDELPEQLRTAEGRREFFREAKQRLGEQRAEREGLAGETAGGGGPEADGPQDDARHDDAPRDSQRQTDEPQAGSGRQYVFDADRIVARVQGREGWLREARRQLEADRWQEPGVVPRSRGERLVIAVERLEEGLEAERLGNGAYERYRAQGRMKDGRRFGGPPKPYVSPEVPEGKVNITDPDSRCMKTREGYVQGYNAQAVVTEEQIVIAAEITTSTVDWSQLDPMVSAAIGELEHAGVGDRPQVALADTQYWNEEHIDEVVASKHVQVLIPPESRTRDQPRPGWTGGRYDWMRAVLKGEGGQQLYRNRSAMIEPAFGNTKHNRGVIRFLRRGRSAVRTEWRLLMATHNLAKLHRHRQATVGARNGPERLGRTDPPGSTETRRPHRRTRVRLTGVRATASSRRSSLVLDWFIVLWAGAIPAAPSPKDRSGWPLVVSNAGACRLGVRDGVAIFETWTVGSTAAAMPSTSRFSGSESEAGQESCGGIAAAAEPLIGVTGSLVRAGVG
jgi:transposase